MTMARSATYVCIAILTGFLMCLTISDSAAQVATGTPAFGSFGGGPFDTVNLGNLNVHFAIPVLNKTGRGTPFNYNLSYDSSIWTATSVSGVLKWQPTYNWGWSAQTATKLGYISSFSSENDCWYTEGRVKYEVRLCQARTRQTA
jgi:hypothetical protein